MAKAAQEDKAIRDVTNYMLKQNRPYSAVDVQTNLRNEFSKTLVVKALDHGVSTGALKEKVIGKQKIYVANQDNCQKFDESALAELDQTIATKTEMLNTLSIQVKALYTELKEAQAMETTENLKVKLAETREKAHKMEERCASLEKTKNNSRADEVKVLMAQEQRNLNETRKRKRIGKDMINSLRDSTGLSKKALIDKLGLELKDDE